MFQELEIIFRQPARILTEKEKIVDNYINSFSNESRPIEYVYNYSTSKNELLVKEKVGDDLEISNITVNENGGEVIDNDSLGENEVAFSFDMTYKYLNGEQKETIVGSFILEETEEEVYKINTGTNMSEVFSNLEVKDENVPAAIVPNTTKMIARSYSKDGQELLKVMSREITRPEENIIDNIAENETNLTFYSSGFYRVGYIINKSEVEMDTRGAEVSDSHMGYDILDNKETGHLSFAELDDYYIMSTSVGEVKTMIEKYNLEKEPNSKMDSKIFDGFSRDKYPDKYVFGSLRGVFLVPEDMYNSDYITFSYIRGEYGTDSFQVIPENKNPSRLSPEGAYEDFDEIVRSNTQAMFPFLEKDDFSFTGIHRTSDEIGKVMRLPTEKVEMIKEKHKDYDIQMVDRENNRVSLSYLIENFN